jgi:hypothetical protein
VKHFKIVSEMGSFYIGRGCYESLRDLVGHYMTTPLFMDRRLGEPLKPAGKVGLSPSLFFDLCSFRSLS